MTRVLNAQILTKTKEDINFRCMGIFITKKKKCIECREIRLINLPVGKKTDTIDKMTRNIKKPQ